MGRNSVDTKRRHTSSVSSSSRSRSRSRDRRSRRHHRRSRQDYSRSHSRSRSFSRHRSFDRSPSSFRRTRYYGTRENPDKSRVIGIFGLHPDTKEDRLLDVFSSFGAIERVSVIYDAKTGNSRGFGFIYYAEIQQATNARTECNGMTLDGKRIRVDYSITKRAHTPTPGVYMGSPHDRPTRSRRRRSQRSGSRYRSRHRSSRRDSYRHTRSRSR